LATFPFVLFRNLANNLVVWRSLRLRPGILFPDRQNQLIFACVFENPFFSKNVSANWFYPGSRDASFTRPAKCSLPFLHAGQLGLR
jgi:hypothetical protein